MEKNQNVQMNHYDSDTEIEDNQTCDSESNQNYQTQNGNVNYDLA